MTDAELLQSFRENIKTYADFARQLGDMVLCNEMANKPLDIVSGEWNDDTEIFQWYIISDPSFAIDHTDELIFHDDELDLYVLGVQTFGTDWNYCLAPDFH